MDSSLKPIPEERVRRGAKTCDKECQRVFRRAFLLERKERYRIPSPKSTRGQRNSVPEAIYTGPMAISYASSFAPAGLIGREELPQGWGLLEYKGRKIEIVHPSDKTLRATRGFRHEMNLLLASLRRVEVRIEPQTITEFLKWKNRMAEYNRGLPEGITAPEQEPNPYLNQLLSSDRKKRDQPETRRHDVLIEA